MQVENSESKKIRTKIVRFKNITLYTIKMDILEVWKAKSLMFFLTTTQVNSYDSLPIGTILTLYVKTLIKLVVNKDKNHYCYKILLEKCLCQSAKK